MNRFAVAIALALVCRPAAAQLTRPASFGSQERTTATQPATAPATQPQSEIVRGTVERVSITDHTLNVEGGSLAYTATAANMLMKDEEGKTKARVFFIAYNRRNEGEAAPQDRPLTFVFNGGPGAAAVWLHLGTAGPACIKLDHEGYPPPPPYRLVDNPHTWLDATDLVFIDPVGTGFSRPAEGEKGSQFYGVREDVAWVADFIRLYLTLYQRWLSPLFLAGESYGTTRAAGLSEHLLEEKGIALNGIILISVVLEFQTLAAGEGNDLPYPLFLPSYTAAAWYHKRLSPELQADLQRTLREVEQWSLETYLVALNKGTSLPADQRREVVERLARYTSLPAEFIERANLRVSPSAFQKRLLEDERKLVGRFDSRIVGHDLDPTAHRPAYDPSLSLYLPVYTATFNDYARRTLKFETTLTYEVLSDRVYPWKWPEGSYVSVSDRLRSAMTKNPHLKVLLASGYFDQATPYFATDWTVARMNLPPELRRNITQTYYLGGHMMYHYQPALGELHRDVTAFIRSAVAGLPGR